MDNKASCISVMGYYSDIQGNKILMHATWTNLKNMLHEIYQEKDKISTVPLMYNTQNIQNSYDGVE